MIKVRTLVCNSERIIVVNFYDTPIIKYTILVLYLIKVDVLRLENRIAYSYSLLNKQNSFLWLKKVLIRY